LIAVYDQSGNAAVYHYDAVANLLSIANYPASQFEAFNLSANSGQPGATIVISGTDFCSSPTVTFNGVTATVVSSTATQIVVTVPSGATTGEIQVTCGSSTIDAGMFTAASGLVPTVTGFSPPTGAEGSSVTITGTNIQPGGTNVLFNTLPALVTSASSTSVTAVVPSNATTGPISVFDQYGEGTSSNNFIVLPPGEIYEGQATVNGSPTTVSFEAGGQKGLLTFQGTAGEQVLISFNDPQLDCMSSATVTNPDGSTLGSVNDLCNGEQYLLAVLPATGVYSITTSDGYDTGSLSIAVDDFSHFSSISVAGGPTSLTVPARQITALRFSGNAGDQISLLAPEGPNGWATILVIAPDGSILATPSIASITYSQAAHYLDSTTLPLTGTYLVLFEGNSYSDDNLSVQIFNAPVVRNNIVPGGAPVTVTASVPGQLNFLSFSGTAGENLTYAFTNVSATGCFGITILDPTQTPVSGYHSNCQYNTYSGYGAGITLPADGTYQVLFDPTVRTGSISFSMGDPTPVTGSIAVGGAPVTMSTNPGQFEDLTFTGSAGQQVSVGISNVSYNEVWGDVRNPDHSIADSFDNNYSSWSPAAYSGPFTLGSDGTYTVELIAEANAGSAKVRLYDASPVNEGTLTLGGGAVSVSGNPGRPIILTFNGTAGEQASLSVTRSTFDRAYVSVSGPDGSGIGWAVVSSWQKSWQNTVLSLSSLPSNGTYRVELTGGPMPGVAKVALYQGSTQTLPITVGGAAVPVTIGTGGQNVALTFDGTAGQTVSAGLTNSTLDTCVTMYLRDPSGNELESLYTCDTTAALDSIKLPSAGTYTIYIDTAGATGSFDVQAYNISPISGTISVDGPVVPLTITTPGQTYNLTFTGSAGQQISFAATNFPFFENCGANATLYDPSGNYVDSTYLDQYSWPDGTGNFWWGTDILPSDGTYTLFFDASCGPMSVNLQLFSAPTLSGTISVNGAAVNVPSNVPAQWSQLTFNGTAGQSINLTTANSTYQDCVYIILNDPNGGYVDSRYSCDPSGSMGPDTLSATGAYSIWVEPYGAPGSVDLNLTGH
jgi:hypothetical protein